MDILLQSLARPKLFVMDVLVFLFMHSVLILVAAYMLRSRYKVLLENSEFYIRIWVPGAFALTFLFCYNLIAGVKLWFVFPVGAIFGIWILSLLWSYYLIYRQLEKK